MTDVEYTYLLILTWQIRGVFPPELFICSGVTWMITILHTSTVKMKGSNNRYISKFNSGLCYWRFYQFILPSSETLGWFYLLLITICSRRKLCWFPKMFFCENLAQLHQNLYLVCCLSLFSIVVLNLLKIWFLLPNQCTFNKDWQNDIVSIKKRFQRIFEYLFDEA